MVSIFFISIYVYVFMCVCVFSHMWLYMSEVNLARPLAIFRFLFTFYFFFKTGLSLALVLQIWSGWPATEPPPPQCWDDKCVPPHLVFSQWLCVESQPCIEFQALYQLKHHLSLWWTLFLEADDRAHSTWEGCVVSNRLPAHGQNGIIICTVAP